MEQQNFVVLLPPYHILEKPNPSLPIFDYAKGNYLRISLMLLGIDLGTGSAKALLLAKDGSAIGEASSS